MNAAPLSPFLVVFAIKRSLDASQHFGAFVFVRSYRCDLETSMHIDVITGAPLITDLHLRSQLLLTSIFVIGTGRAACATGYGLALAGSIAIGPGRAACATGSGLA